MLTSQTVKDWFEVQKTPICTSRGTLTGQEVLERRFCTSRSIVGIHHANAGAISFEKSPRLLIYWQFGGILS